MHVNSPLLQSLPNFSHGEPRAGQVSGGIKRQRYVSARELSRRQSKDAASDGSSELGFPFLGVRRAFDELDVALRKLRQIVPAPEFRRSGTGDAGDGGSVAFALDGNGLPFGGQKRRGTSGAIFRASEQPTRK